MMNVPLRISNDHSDFKRLIHQRLGTVSIAYDHVTGDTHTITHSPMNSDSYLKAFHTLSYRFGWLVHNFYLRLKMMMQSSSGPK